MPITPLRNRKPDAYRIIPKVPRYYAFGFTPTGLLATIYASDGTWLADRGEIALSGDPPTAENGTLIHSIGEYALQASPSPGGRGGDGRGGQGVRIFSPSPAPRGRVGEGALAWRSGPHELTVWDVTNAVVHTYQSADSVLCSPPVHHEGRLYWVELPPHHAEPDPHAATFTCRHSPPDLSDPRTFATAVLSFGVDRWDLGSRIRVAVSPSALLVETLWFEAINHEGSAVVGARFPFAAPGLAEAGGVLLDLEQGFAAAEGTTVGLHANENSLRAHTLALGSASTTRWPTTGPWALNPTLNAAVTADGTTALLYGGAEDEPNPVVLEAPAHATFGNPAIRQTLAPHPVHGEWPNLIFFLE